MKQFRNTVIRAGLEALYFSGAHALLRPIFGGVGAIFMLHHVRPTRRDAEFQPNRHLEVEPEFLRAMLEHVRGLDVDIVTMDEMHARLVERNLARQSEVTAAFELATSRARIEDALRRPILHFAYPYGDRIAAGPREFSLAKAAGFKTAVTTRPGMIFPASAEHLTALQRVSLNGNYQDQRILPVLTSGAATAVWNGFRRIDAA
jgi:peptidoglycan/xylan/chitin deacetylase (PgdA/CDA1 family)